MNQPRDARGKNGCLHALLGLGVLLVAAGVALEMLPELEFPEIEREQTVDRGFGTPQQPAAPYTPPPLAPTPPPVAPPPVAPAAPTAQHSHTLLWHAETPENPSVPCVLRIDVSETFSPVSAAVLCADGRQLFSVRPRPGRLAGIGTRHGARLRAEMRPSRATDDAGNLVAVSIDPDNHQISIIGPSTLPNMLFVEELSVPNPSIHMFEQGTVNARFVRLAVPTLVNGPIPSSIAMVRATGRAPRANDPVCELSGGPNPNSRFNCRLVLRCHGEVIYGLNNSGYNDCTVTDERSIAGATDTGTTAENSDPRVDLDMAEGRLIVSDVSARGEWSASFDLIDPPSCGASQAYAGSVLSGGTTSEFRITPAGESTSMTLHGRVEPMNGADASGCPWNALAYDNPFEGQARVRLFFGPRARSIAGYVGSDGEAAWAFAP